MEFYGELYVDEASRFLVRLAEISKREFGDLIRTEMGLQIKEVVRALPPGKSVSARSFTGQKKRGEIRVASDILKVYATTAEVAAEIGQWDVDAAKGFGKAMRAGDGSAAQGILQRSGSRYLGAKLGGNLDPGYHEGARRTQTGRVYKGHRTSQVVNSKAELNRYIREEKRGVGKLKGEFLPRGGALQITGIPKWVSQHQGAYVVDRSKAVNNPYILVHGETYSRSQERIVRAAVQVRENALRRDVEAKLAFIARRAGA